MTRWPQHWVAARPSSAPTPSACLPTLRQTTSPTSPTSLRSATPPSSTAAYLSQNTPAPAARAEPTMLPLSLSAGSAPCSTTPALSGRWLSWVVSMQAAAEPLPSISPSTTSIPSTSVSASPQCTPPTRSLPRLTCMKRTARSRRSISLNPPHHKSRERRLPDGR